MKPKTKRPLSAPKIEPLESRIAPAGLMLNDAKFVSTAAGSPLLVSAGEGLSTSDAGGVYLLYVEKGEALVFTTDLNGNNQLDVNEITGIAAGDGLSITIFTDVFGDIVTNLKADGTLTDSDNNPGNGRDGQVLANSRIDKIEMRSLVAGDLENQATLNQKIAYSTFSVFGAVMAGKGVGAADGTGGFIIDTTGEQAIRGKYTLNAGFQYPASGIPTLSEIRTGTAASNQPFRFTLDPSGGFSGVLTSFLPPTGQVGGDIAAFEVRGTNQQVNLDGLYTGAGGFGARGGNIGKVVIGQDDHGGYVAIAGDGGIGNTGGAGGSILDFSDLGSVTGAVVIRAGDGGAGLTGTGGAGGTIGLGTMNLVGNLLVETGSGGDGFTSGGAGASFLSGVFEFADEIDPAVGLAVQGTTRSLYSITQDEGVDFNDDGFGDFVWTTDLPDQLVVGLGSGFGDVEEVIYLPATVDPGSLALADFNGDGLTDIAVASSGSSSAPFVRVFMATRDSFGDFAGFSRPLDSPLPDLSDDSLGDYLSGTAPITAMVVGDFNADGTYDLAVNAQYAAKKFNGGTVTAVPHHLVMVLEGLGNGSFAADFGGAQAPFSDLGEVADGDVVLRATVLDEAGEDRDVILWGQKGKDTISVVDYFEGVGMAATAFFGLGKVDTNREVATMDSENKSTAAVTLGDFDAFDLGGDGIADIVVLAAAPSMDVVELFTWDGVDFIDDMTGGARTGNDIDQAGIFVQDVTFLGVKGMELGGNPGDEVVFYQETDDGIALQEMEFEQPPAGEPNPPGAGGEPFYQLATLNLFPFLNDDGTNLVAFDAFIPDLGVPDTVNYAILHPAGQGDMNDFLAVVGDASFDSIFYTGDNQVTIDTGDGGDSSTGSGGVGGSIGAGSLSVADGVASGSVRFDLPDDDIVFGASIDLVAGNGGNGLQSGGNGGSVSGIAGNGAEGGGVFASSFGLFGGNGGNGVLGGGGNGGGISKSSVYAGSTFQGGDGGRGKTGGSGGSVTGNGGLRFDTFFSGADIRGGDGGNGIKSGGNGGGVSGFDVQITNIVGELTGGSVFYSGGDGGNASAGSGGSGGSITDSGPSTEVNKIGGSLEANAGNGGNGKTGGAGGSIVNFINAPTVSVTPTAFSLLAGAGGRGISGNGGKGGSVSTASISGDGTAEGFPQFARVLGGSGGKSAGATGGDGGGVTGVDVTSKSAPLAIVAGGGGDGLIKGGVGGSVTGTSGNASGLGGDKVLVIAGDGGAANASLPFNHASPLLPPTPLDILKSFGGKNGIGGNGGNIASFTQPTSTEVRVDLIAGNGGSTPYYGTPFDDKVGVGKGGSITNAKITGHIGNPSADVPISDYNDFEEIGDTANAIGTDSAGNHAVAGSSEDDLFIAKYDNATGALLWSVVVDVLMAGERDEAFALAIDAMDNIVVAGVTGDDLYVRKVSGVDGSLIWEYAYTAPGGASAAADIALDSAGNALVTGFGVNGMFDEDIYVAKLAAATGLPVWESLIDGPGVGFDKDDAGRAIAVDSADNAVLTGYVDGDYFDFDGDLIFFDSDLYTAKFSAAAGAVVWTFIHDGAGAGADIGNDIAVDSADNVIITGFETGASLSEDIYTAKYDGVGDGFGGTTATWEVAYDGAVSDSGLFFGGTDRGNQLAIDSADNVVVAGAVREDFGQGLDVVVLKYAALDGMPVWADAIDPLLPDPLILTGEGTDIATSLAIDAADDVFLGGFVTSQRGDTDFLAAKADGLSGGLIWSQQFDGAFNDRVNAITIEPTGDLVVAGDSFRRGGTDAQLIRYATANGAEVWEERFDGETEIDGVTADFVRDKIRTAVAGDSLTDFDGLVGIVVGASGRLLNGQPASSALNGSLTGLTLQASSFLMSAVAGSVTNIAAIEKISGIVLDGGGVPVPSSLGTDKDPTGFFDYIDTNGMVVSQPTAPSLQAGWGLIDGAIFGREIVGISGSRVFDLP